jgi:hypothetical protein
MQCFYTKVRITWIGWKEEVKYVLVEGDPKDPTG